MDDREGGFIVIHRRIQSWPLWRCMTGVQRMVWVQILLDANWKDGEAWHGAEKFPVKRGQLIHSENTIAGQVGVSRKVVRTVIEKLVAEGAVERKRALGRAHGPHLLTVVNYSKYQDVRDDEGPRSGPAGAQHGPRAGQAGALSEPEEPWEPELLPTATSAVDPAGTPQDPPQQTTAKGAARATGHAGNGRAAPKPAPDPRHHPVRLMLAAVYAEKRRGQELPWDQSHAGRLAKLLRAVPSATVEEFERRWRYALDLRAYPGCADAMTFFARWAELVPGPAPPAKANGGIRGHTRQWWEELNDEQRREFMRERHEVAPELDSAPFDVAGEFGHERSDVLALLARWRARAERRVMA